MYSHYSAPELRANFMHVFPSMPPAQALCLSLMGLILMHTAEQHLSISFTAPRHLLVGAHTSENACARRIASGALHIFIYRCKERGLWNERASAFLAPAAIALHHAKQCTIFIWHTCRVNMYAARV
jgi:hypothetical protein